MSEPVSSIDAYLADLQRLAQICLETSATPHEFIERPPQEHQDLVKRNLRLRSEFLAESEERTLGAYLELGLFDGLPRRDRIVAFAFAFDLQHAVDALVIDRQCERYNSDQPLFAGAPSLLRKIRRREIAGEPDYELIEAQALTSVSGSELYKVDNGYGKLTRYLNPGIVNWAQASFPDAPLFIRLDPYFFSTQQPLQLLTEATLVPANPKWLPGFTLRKGMKEFAAYALSDVSPRDDQAQFWDYRVRGLRRLEVRAERREKNYLTMMIEELPRPDDPSGLMIGRCIHLDSRDPAGTSLDQVQVSHLDLAINVYKGATRAVRTGQTLQHGKIVDASCRTHLLRIEGAPFISLFQFCRMFFQSSVLLSEWLNELSVARAPEAR